MLLSQIHVMESDCNRPELQDEVKLSQSGKEREKYDSQADLFAVVTTLQCLERAYIKDCIRHEEYHAECSRLIAQVKPAYRQVQADFPSIEAFVKKYRVRNSAKVCRAS